MAVHLSAAFANAILKTLPVSPSAQISIAEIAENGERLVQVSTSTPELHKYFFILIGEVIDVVVRDGADPFSALQRTLDQWRALLQSVGLLSEERQIGLIGELWLLDRLREQLGPSTITSWTGPDREPHDFRVGSFEFEVKVTRAEARIHTINGLYQLQQTPGRTLFILSLQLAPAGTGGQSLPARVHKLRAELGNGQGRPSASSPFWMPVLDFDLPMRRTMDVVGCSAALRRLCL